MDKQIIGTTESWLIELAFVCLLLQGICTGHR